MPVRRNGRSYRARRRFRRRTSSYAVARRRYRRRGIVRRVPRTITSMFRLVKLKYTGYIDLDPDNIVYYKQYNFRANSVYDPDYTGGASVALGYGQWSAFYPTWCVIGSKIKFQVMSRDTNQATVPAMVGITLGNDVTLPSNWTNTTLMDNPNTSSKMIAAGPHVGPKTIYQKYSAKKWWGVNMLKNEDALWGQTTSVPNKQTFYTVWVAAADGTTNIGPIAGLVTIEYLCLFRNPNFVSL